MPFGRRGAHAHLLPACHSEATAEESHFVYFYFVLLAILRFSQDDKLGFVGVLSERHCAPVCRGGFPLPPADFDVILCGRGFSPKTGTLLSAFADISPNRGITRHYAQKYIACVGVGVLDDPLFLPLMREVAFAAGKRRRERDEKNLSPSQMLRI